MMDKFGILYFGPFFVSRKSFIFKKQKKLDFVKFCLNSVNILRSCKDPSGNLSVKYWYQQRNSFLNVPQIFIGRHYFFPLFVERREKKLIIIHVFLFFFYWKMIDRNHSGKATPRCWCCLICIEFLLHDSKNNCSHFCSFPKKKGRLISYISWSESNKKVEFNSILVFHIFLPEKLISKGLFFSRLLLFQVFYKFSSIVSQVKS